MTENFDVAAARAAVLARIDDALRAANRPPNAAQLIAVSKRQPEDRIDAALAAGHRVFGENRVQEAAAHWAARRPNYTDLELRLIGPLQTNKAREAVALFDVIETLDRPKLARTLAAAAEEADKTLEVFVQVNTGEEDQKSGVSPGDVDDFVAEVRRYDQLSLAGLMCIPPVEEPPGPHFALLAKIAERNTLSQLSMGMSGDFETAIRFGATHVRVGAAIFGPRED